MTSSLAAGKIAPIASRTNTAYAPCDAMWDWMVEVMLASTERSLGARADRRLKSRLADRVRGDNADDVAGGSAPGPARRLRPCVELLREDGRHDDAVRPLHRHGDGRGVG